MEKEISASYRKTETGSKTFEISKGYNEDDLELIFNFISENISEGSIVNVNITLDERKDKDLGK